MPVQFDTSEEAKPVPVRIDTATRQNDVAGVAPVKTVLGIWYVNARIGIAFGQMATNPQQRIAIGDGKADVAVFRNGIWYLNRVAVRDLPALCSARRRFGCSGRL